MTPLQKLIFESIRFSLEASWEDRSFENSEGDLYDPEVFLMNYTSTTKDRDWDTLARRIAEIVAELEDKAWKYDDLCR